ncbi:MAG: hypothetical protein AB1452_03105 [Pseudomonadota bacterium]
MNTAHGSLDAALGEVVRLRAVLKRGNSNQVQSTDELGLLKGTALAWFNNHRKVLVTTVGDQATRAIDASFTALLQLGDRRPSRSKCDDLLKDLKNQLSAVRAQAVNPVNLQQKTSDQPPDFSVLIADATMQTILAERWRECGNCIVANAPLAATVMMGGLLEGLLLARVHREADKTRIFGATGAPRDKASGKALPLKEWTLKNYIDVAHELTWISQPARDLGDILRDYRNYIHPEKQRAQGLSFRSDDVAMFWEVAKGICRQLITRQS